MRSILAFALAVALLMLGRATEVHSQDPLFGLAPGSPVPVGAGAGQIILAEINGDGHLDLLTQHLLSQRVTVLLGDGAGRFAAAPGSPMLLAYPPGGMQLGDVNNDGILDLGIRNTDRDDVYVYLGNGRGKFYPVHVLPFSASPIHTDRVGTRRWQAPGGAVYFPVHTVYFPAVRTPTKPSLHLLDVNADGSPDFVTTNGRWNSLATLLGDGRGGFAPGPVTQLGPGDGFFASAFGDVDGDGLVDVVTALGGQRPGLGPDLVVVRRGDGTGAFRDPTAPPLSVPGDPRVAALADVNGDRRPDIVISHSGNRLSVLLNRGDGRLAMSPTSPNNLGATVYGVVVADANRDGQADLLATTVSDRTAPYPSSIAVLLGDGRTFVPAPGSPFAVGPGAYNFAVGDVNDDGKLDVAASSFEGDAVTLLLGR